MNKTVRWSLLATLALTLFPAFSYARPIRAISHSNTGVVRQRSPQAITHQSILHHS